MLSNGIRGAPISILTANPKNYHQLLSNPTEMPEQTIHGKLFLPRVGTPPYPVVIVVPGSMGLDRHHIEKALPLTEAGIAACLLDPFHARSVSSTTANQVLYSYAASTWDVLATAALLADIPQIDEQRIGAQGHDRGGGAVLNAATRVIADACPAPGLNAVYAAYPWSGHQFLQPGVGKTRVRAIIGDQDEWCLPQQVQSHIQGIRAAGCDASFRLIGGAHHFFDQNRPVEHTPDAALAPDAPIVYVDDQGLFHHPLGHSPDPKLTDRDMYVYSAKAGYARFGARYGGGDKKHLRDAFYDDMMTFWTSAMFTDAG